MYEQLTKDVNDFECGTCAFQAGSPKMEISDWLSPKTQARDLKPLVRLDAKMKN